MLQEVTRRSSDSNLLTEELQVIDCSPPYQQCKKTLLCPTAVWKTPCTDCGMKSDSGVMKKGKLLTEFFIKTMRVCLAAL